MGRTWALGLAAAALLATAGCSKSGSYRLSWDFLVDQSTGAIETTAAGCGQHGVDSILATGMDDAGDSLQVIALCVPGQFSGSAPPGTWTFALQMLDAEENPIASPMSMQPSPAPIATSGPPALFSISFVPLSDCIDHIDNDGDGLIDTGSECDAGPAGARDGGTSGDGGQPEGGATGVGDGGPQDGGTLDARG